MGDHKWVVTMNWGQQYTPTIRRIHRWNCMGKIHGKRREKNCMLKHDRLSIDNSLNFAAAQKAKFNKKTLWENPESCDPKTSQLIEESDKMLSKFCGSQLEPRGPLLNYTRLTVYIERILLLTMCLLHPTNVNYYNYISALAFTKFHCRRVFGEPM